MAEYTSNINAVIGELLNDIKQEAQPTTLSRVAAEQLLGDIVYRIHNEGKNASGGQISGGYSTKPIYISLSGFIRQGKVRGKKNTSPTLKNGKPRKSSYFEDGYKGFKQNQTGNTQVNLVLSGDLQRDLLISKAGDSFGLSFGAYGLELHKDLEKKYAAKIWFPTDEEYNNMIIAIEEYLKNKVK